MARHVITTTKPIPLEGSQEEAQETAKDGWYIDFAGRLSCEPKTAEGTGTFGVVMARAGVGGAVGGGKMPPMEKPEIVEIGPRETGFSVKEVRTSPGAMTRPDGMSKPLQSTNESEVMQLEEEPIDPGLFEIPTGFKQVERERGSSR